MSKLNLYLLDSVFNSATTQAENINRLHIYYLFGAAFILLTVVVPTIYIVVKFGSRKGENKEIKHLSGKWEIPMIGVPAVLVIVFFVLMLDSMKKVLPSAKGHVAEVVVTGHQFWWEAYYPQSKVTTANEIHLPAGRNVLVKLQSADVIHDWWVPEFGNKMDLIPGKDNFLWINVKKPGTYQGACSEFCGDQHAGMRLTVIAEGDDDYNKWLATQAKPAVENLNGIAATGEELFNTQTCASCHTIDGTVARGRDGPNLTHLASRSTLLTGLLPNDPEHLSMWIQHPQQIKPGSKMPDPKLDAQSVHQLAAYLSQLK